MKKTLEDYANLLETPNVEERSRMIENLYQDGKEYFYTGLGKDELYRVGWNE